MNHRHFQTFRELSFTLGFCGERGVCQASAQFTYRVRLSSISDFSELPFPETGYAGLEQRLYIQHQYSDTISTPVICTTRGLRQTFSSSSYTTLGGDPTGHRGDL